MPSKLTVTTLLAAIKHCLLSLLIGLIWLTLPATASAFYTISSNGGQCTEIGVWDETTSTCTLTTTVTEPIIITGQFITLDGSGHTVDLTEESDPYGVEVHDVLGVTVKNIVFEAGGIYFRRADAGRAEFNEIYNAAIGIDFFDLNDGTAEGNVVEESGAATIIAITAQDASNLNIQNNKISNAETGLRFVRVDLGSIVENTITEVETGFDFTAVSNFSISDNVIDDALTAFFLQVDESEGNQVTNNTFTNAETGLALQSAGGGGPDPTFSSSFMAPLLASFAEWITPLRANAQAVENVFSQNNFISNTNHVTTNRPADVLFSLPLPEGGNYWDTFDESSEGCLDGDNDGFCDTDYTAAPQTLADEFPRTTVTTVTLPSPQCSDGLDNDDDGLTDFPDDPGCDDVDDQLEANVLPPACTLSVDPITITIGESTTLSWTSERADTVSIDNGIGDVEMAGSLTVTPNMTTNYTATVVNDGGESTCVTTVTVGGVEPAALHERAAAFATELVNQPDGYLWGGKGWDFTLGEFVPASTILSGYNYYNPDTGAVQTGIGLDCSGLITWAYNFANDASASFQNNFITYENAAGQATDAQSEPVAEADLRPGDTLYFDFNFDGKIDHTAIYVGDQGDYDVVNSSESDVGIVPEVVSSYSLLNSFQFFRRPVQGQVAMAAEASSPVDLTVTDPDGNTLSFTDISSTEREYIREVPGELYYSESVQGHDGNPADVVYAPVLKDGQYQITVTPNSEIASDDTYSLRFRTEETVIDLAVDELISDLPEEGFAVAVTEGIPEEIEPQVDPETLFAELSVIIKAAHIKSKLLKPVLKLKLYLAKKLYRKDHDQAAIKLLKSMKRLVKRAERKIAPTDAALMLAHIKALVSAIQSENEVWEEE